MRSKMKMRSKMMKSKVDLRRQRGQSMMDLIFALVILAMGTLGIDAMDVSQQLRETNLDSQTLATAIAVGERDRIEAMPYEALQPTDGFEAPEWIQTPGLDRGAVPVAATTKPLADRAPSPQIYSVKWQVVNADRWGSMRRIEVLVEWEKPNRELGRVVVTSLRAGMHAG